MASWEGAVAAVAGIAAAVVGYAARKKARGRVRDTEAEVLWAQLSGELAAVRKDLKEYREENVQLRIALEEANRKAQEAHEEAEQLRARVADLEDKLARVERAGNGGTL